MSNNCNMKCSNTAVRKRTLKLALLPQIRCHHITDTRRSRAAPWTWTPQANRKNAVRFGLGSFSSHDPSICVIFSNFLNSCQNRQWCLFIPCRRKIWSRSPRCRWVRAPASSAIRAPPRWGTATCWLNSVWQSRTQSSTPRGSGHGTAPSVPDGISPWAQVSWWPEFNSLRWFKHT